MLAYSGGNRPASGHAKPFDFESESAEPPVDSECDPTAAALVLVAGKFAVGDRR